MAKKNENGHKFNKLYASYMANARKRDLAFEIDETRFKEIIISSCYYCGETPNNPYSQHNKKIFNYTGIDRVDPSCGYFESNIVPCCKICNRFKLDMSYEKFIEWIINLHNCI